VGVAANGSFTVVWETYRSYVPLDIDLIQGRRFDAEGRPQGPYFLVDPYPSGYQSSPRLAVAADGSFYVTWLQGERESAESRFVLKARHFGTNGRADGPVFRVGTGDGGEGFFDDPPDVVVTPGGGFAAIWQRRTGGPDDESALIVRAFSPGGRPLGPEVVIATAPRGPLSPALAAGARDRLVAVWLEHGGGVPTLLYRQLAANGEPLGPAREVRSEVGDVPLDPAVAMSRKGDFLAAWTEDPTPGDELGPGGTRILARAFNPAGEPIGYSVAVVDGALDLANGKPAVVADPSGGYLVAWTAGREPPGFPFADILVRRFRPKNQAFAAPYYLAKGGIFSQVVASFGLGGGRRGAVTWDGYGIEARRLAPRPVP
jgi:hypothetical protein